MKQLSSLFFAVATSLSTLASAATAPHYSASVVASPFANTSLYILKVNNLSHFAAAVVDDSGNQSFYLGTAAGDFTEIVVPNASITSIGGLNGSDMVVGASTLGGFVWSPANGASFIAAPNGYFDPHPTGVNGNGEVTGYVYDSSDELPSDARGFHWTLSKGVQIMRPEAWLVPSAVNKYGHIVGTLHFMTKRGGNATDTLLYNGNTSYTRIGDLVRGRTPDQSNAVALNNHGSIALNCLENIGGSSAVVPAIWKSDTDFHDLGLDSGVVIAIDDSDEIIGNVLLPNYYPFIWEKGLGALNINTLIDQSPVRDPLRNPSVGPEFTTAG